MRRVLTVAGLLLLLIGVTATAASAASAPGWYAEHSTEERQAIVDYVYERSGHATVPYSGEAAATAELISQEAIDSGTHEFPLAGELGSEEFTLVQDVGLMSRIGTYLPVIGLGVGTFATGFAIGTLARKLYGEITGPDEAALGGSWAWNSASWQLYGTEIFYGAKVQQRPGAYVFNAGYSGISFPIARWFESPCDFSGFSGPRGARIQTHVSSEATCQEYVEPEYVYYPVFVDYPYLLEGDFRLKAPLRPFDSRRDWAEGTVESPPDPGTRTVESALEALDGNGYEVLREQTDWALTPGAQEEEEPARRRVELSPEDIACKAYFAEAGGIDPGARAPRAEPRAADWDYDVDHFENVYNPLTHETQSVTLRWGTPDWGYRHIVTEHGWDVAAAARTQLALETDTTPVLSTRDKSGRSFIYYFNIPSLPNRMRCRQLVVVSYRLDSAVPVGRGVISSYLDAY